MRPSTLKAEAANRVAETIQAATAAAHDAVKLLPDYTPDPDWLARNITSMLAQLIFYGDHWTTQGEVGTIRNSEIAARLLGMATAMGAIIGQLLPGAHAIAASTAANHIRRTAQDTAENIDALRRGAKS